MRLHRFLRNRAIRIARRVSTPVLSWRASHAPRVLALHDVQRRLELLLAAMYGRPIRVTSVTGVAGAPAPNAGDVVLPPQLGAAEGPDEALARYRALAIVQGARVARGTHELHVDDALTRDLYLLAESAEVERSVVERAPSLAPTLRALRAGELRARATRDRLSEVERPVELLLRAMLAADPERIPSPLVASESPAASRAWAVAMADAIRGAARKRDAHYRRLRTMSIWGVAWSRFGAEEGLMLGGVADGLVASSQSESDDRGTKRSADGSAGHNDDRRADSDDDSAPTPSERGAVDSRSGDASDERDNTEDDAPSSSRASGAHVDDSRVPLDGSHYPEWDEDAGRLVADASTVHCSVAEGDDERWAADVLSEHAPLVRQIRDRFAPLRARRLRLRRQRSGDELDLDACVAAHTDRRVGQSPNDNLYELSRSTRHSIAILLLVDVSGSTRTKLADGRTILDVERMTLLLASEALATLGDPYAMLAFSGCGRHRVRMRTLKAFDEHDDAAVRRRISALVASENTRLGAAVRHATAVLAAQPAQRRVLLVLSDGRPNDVDRYQGSFAIEDSRHALLAARASGVHPFCLTVDQEEEEYLPRLFGEHGYLVLHEPAQLPNALLRVVDRLLRA